jgi:hypothetical protein
MEDDPKTPSSAPESLLPYDRWMEDALRQVVVRALNRVAAEGLPGQHHFYLTFRTDYPGVVVPARLKAKYPQEMTIVLQHKFDDLVVDEAGRSFGVSLYFGGVRSSLTVPLDAVSAFADPHVQFGLRFGVVPPPAPVPAIAAPVPVVEAVEGQPQVVSLDAFRRRKD